MKMLALAAFLLLSMLFGCTAPPDSKTVEAATQPNLTTHSKFQLVGTQGGEFLVDSDTGTVWQYQDKAGGFVRISVQPEDKVIVVTPEDMKQ